MRRYKNWTLRRLLPGFVAALMVVAVPMVVPASASASYTYTHVGDCTFWSHNPDISSSGWVRGWSQLGNCDFGTSSNVVELESCLEKNTGGGWSGTYNCTVTGAYTDYSNGQQAGCGTWFRTWAWAKVEYWDGAGNHWGPYYATLISPADYWC